MKNARRFRAPYCLALLVVVFALHGAHSYAQDSQDCLMCHGETDITRELESGKVISLYVDGPAFQASIHGPMDCITCHASIEELPHEEKLDAVDCGGCHEAAEVYAESLHGRALLSGDKDAAACQDCHGKHDIRPSTDPLSRVHPRNMPQTCGVCHSDPSLVEFHMISVAKPSDAYLKGIHAREIRENGNLDAAVCNDCHGTHDILPSQDPDSPIFDQNIPQTCGQCHETATQEFLESIHGKALAAGIPDAPNCTDCHGEHDVQPPQASGSPVSPELISTTTCVRCHENERIMTRYGIEVHRQASYMDSYHGVTSIAGTKAANCTSCHGVHTIQKQDHPASTTHPENLVATCGQCHENANENFASSPVHTVSARSGQTALAIVRLIYYWVIGLTIGFMVLHNGLLMAHHLIAKLKHNLDSPAAHKRFGWGHRASHLFLMVSFMVLVVSGFALRYPESWWVQAVFLGDLGIEYRSAVHRAAGVILIAVILVHILYLAGSRAGHKELWHLLPKWKDLRDTLHTLSYTIGLRRAAPKMDRYSYKEKLEYWGLMWGSAVMILTGLCMWYADSFLAYFPKIALDILALIHFLEAILAFLTIIVWHLYFVVFDPGAYPMNWSWLTGRISEKEFKEHHALQYEREQRDRPRPTIPGD